MGKTASGNFRFVVCIENEGYASSLDTGKIYRVVRPLRGDPKSMVRVIDASGEDYLYPREKFVPLKLPAKAAAALANR
jgi:hypothetical protein